MSKAADKFQRIYKNQSKDMRLSLMLDYEVIVKDPTDNIGRHIRKQGWTQQDLEEMLSLLRESLS